MPGALLWRPAFLLPSSFARAFALVGGVVLYSILLTPHAPFSRSPVLPFSRSPVLLFSRCSVVRSAAKHRISSLAGSSIPGHQDGVAASAQFCYTSGLVYSPTHDTVFVADSGNHSVRAITPTHPVLHGRRRRRLQPMSSPRVRGVAVDTLGVQHADDAPLSLEVPEGTSAPPQASQHLRDEVLAFVHVAQGVLARAAPRVVHAEPLGASFNSHTTSPAVAAAASAAVAVSAAAGTLAGAGAGSGLGLGSSTLDPSLAGSVHASDEGRKQLRRAGSLSRHASSSTLDGGRSDGVDGDEAASRSAPSLGTCRCLCVSAVMCLLRVPHPCGCVSPPSATTVCVCCKVQVVVPISCDESPVRGSRRDRSTGHDDLPPPPRGFVCGVDT